MLLATLGMLLFGLAAHQAMSGGPRLPAGPPLREDWDDGEAAAHEALRTWALVSGLVVLSGLVLFGTIASFLAGDDAAEGTRPTELAAGPGVKYDPAPPHPRANRNPVPDADPQPSPRERPAEPPARPRPMPKAPDPDDLEPVPSPRPARPQPEPDNGEPATDPGADAPFTVDPRLEKATGKVYLSDLTAYGWKNGALGWSYGRNGSLGNSYKPNATIVVKGQPSPKGLSTHPPLSREGYASVRFALGQKAKMFEGAVAVSEDERFPPRGVRFGIVGDGKILWRSNVINGFGVVQKFHLDVSRVKELELRAGVEGISNTGAHAVWLDPYVTVE
jgi:hypothetical protein